MLQSEIFVALSDFERQLFTRLVPEDHFLRQLEGIVDFERFRPALAEHYAPRAGRPALDPVMMLELDCTKSTVLRLSRNTDTGLSSSR